MPFSSVLGNRSGKRVTQGAPGDRGALSVLQTSETQPHVSSQSMRVQIIPSEVAFL